MVRYAAPGGRVHIYLYWRPELRWHRAVLRLVTAARRVTVRMPHRLLHILCYPIAAGLWLSIVAPYRALRARPRTAALVDGLPLKTYAEYPFGVLLNDQFDRFSAPLERRYSREQVEALLQEVGLEGVTVHANAGWVGEGRVPDDGLAADEDNPGLSVVVPVLNDPEGLRTVMAGLLSQTRRPDEIVVVDGGSSDGTLDVLSELDFGAIDLEVMIEPGVNIAGARNAGVRRARYGRIASTDAGCLPEPRWLAALESGFSEADLVGGVVVPDASSVLQRVFAVTHYPAVDELQDRSRFVRISHRLFGRGYVNYRPGGGSMAFAKTAWNDVGGFPERQHAGEDHAFARSATDAGYNAVLTHDARIHWSPPSTWMGNVLMFYTYCRGDVRSKGRARHFVRITAWTLGSSAVARGRTGTRISLAAAGLAYISLPIRRARTSRVPMRGLLAIPPAVAVKDLAQIAGACHGALDAILGRPQPSPRREPRIRTRGTIEQSSPND